MARPRKVEHDDALRSLQDLFWLDGYAGVSTRDIESKTGLTKFTLQTSYGGKKALFLETLDRYLTLGVLEFLPRPDKDVLEGLARWFEDQCKPENMPPATAHGCLALNTITEFERGDAEADSRIDRYLAMLRTCFTEALEKGKALGEVDRSIDIAEKTELLVGSVLGLNMMLRAATRADAASAFGSSVGATIRGWHSRPVRR